MATHRMSENLCPNCDILLRSTGRYLFCDICNQTYYSNEETREMGSSVTVLRATWLMWATLMVVFTIQIIFCGAVLTKINALDKKGIAFQDEQNRLRNNVDVLQDNNKNAWEFIRRGQCVHGIAREMVLDVAKEVGKLKER